MSAPPNGWTQAALLNLATLNPKTDEQDSMTCGFAPMQALGTSFRTPLKFESRPWGDVKKAYTHFKNGDVLMAKVTPCFENGKAGIAANLPNGIGAGSSEFFVIRPSNGVDARYLLGWLSTEAFRKRAALAMTGSVGLKRVPKDLLQTEVIPVAPAAEQKRIADKLDTVLTRVDAVNTRLARVAPLLKRFRQSVLAAATSGRLTAELNGGAISSLVELGSFCSVYGGKRLPKGFQLSDFDTGFPYVRVTDFDSFSVKTNQLKYVPQEAAREISRYIINASDVYISIAGSIGLVGQVPAAIDGANLTENAARIVPSKELSPVFLMYQLASPQLQEQMHEKKIATTQDKLGLFRIKTLTIWVPELDEQTEIVRRVETLFAFADRLEARLAQAQTAATRLTPALLAKAFRGELVPQDPNDEPAAELLRRLAQVTPATTVAKRGRKSNATQSGA
jgi:type I restriction enzyme, S subunit